MTIPACHAGVLEVPSKVSWLVAVVTHNLASSSSSASASKSSSILVASSWNVILWNSRPVMLITLHSICPSVDQHVVYPTIALIMAYCLTELTLQACQSGDILL